METHLITLHEAHINELDIHPVISQLEAEKELWGLLGFPSPERQGLSMDLDEEVLNEEDEGGEVVDPDPSAPSATTNTDPNALLLPLLKP